MVCYPLLYINIKMYVYLILTFNFLSFLLISATLACNVGLVQRTCLLIHPAAYTPDLVQSSFVLAIYIRICSLSIFMFCKIAVI